MKFIKHHWFNLLIALLIILSMTMTLLITFAPKEDRLNRGFIPCTLELASNLQNCDGKLWCAVKTVVKNSACDAKVIGKGLKMWISGEQPAPWSNYFFSPDLSHLEQVSDENVELFYQENPNHLQDFEDVKNNYRNLEESKANDEEEK